MYRMPNPHDLFFNQGHIVADTVDSDTLLDIIFYLYCFKTGELMKSRLISIKNYNFLEQEKG